MFLIAWQDRQEERAAMESEMKLKRNGKMKIKIHDRDDMPVSFQANVSESFALRHLTFSLTLPQTISNSRVFL